MNIAVDGLDLAYDCAGSGADTLVLIHGFLLDRSIWQAQFVALARSCRVIRVDLRGSGESGLASGPALPEMLAGDLCGLLDALGIERVMLAGHSLGGYVALAFFRMYAERVGGLGLIASSVSADSFARRAERDALVAAIAQRGIDAAVEAYAPAGGAAPWAAHVRAIMERQSAAGASAQLGGMKDRLSSEDLLADILVPTTLVAGGDDRTLASDALERTAAAIADCEIVRVAGCGRLPMVEAPVATTGVLERLVMRCAARRSADPRSGRAARA